MKLISKYNEWLMVTGRNMKPVICFGGKGNTRVEQEDLELRSHLKGGGAISQLCSLLRE